MPQVQPSAEILYRIQNVDYGQYLEFSSPERQQKGVHSRIVRRSTGDLSDSQARTFIKLSMRPLQKFFTMFILPLVWKQATVLLWLRTKIVGRPIGRSTSRMAIPIARSISTPNPNANARGKVLLQMDSDGSTKVDEDKRQDKQKWKIIEVLPVVEPSPPLAKGTYRVRNIDSTLVLTGQPDSVTLAKQESGKDQAWEILPKGNGRYEIKKDGKTDYLTWQDDKVTVANKPGVWIVRSLGPFIYSISPKLDEGKDDLSLTAGKSDKNEVLLTAREIVRSQVWFIEPFKSAAKLDSPEPEYPEPGSRDQPERFAVSGVVGIQKLQTSWRVSYSNGDRKISNMGTGLVAGGWIMSYESPVSPYFTLQAAGSIVYASMSGDTLVPSRSAMLWYLARDGSNQGCYICPKGQSRLVWGYGPSIEGVSDYLLPLRLVERKANTPSQMWRIGDYQ